MLASSILTMMLLPKQLQTFPHSMQQPGQWAAHLTRGVDILVACYTCTEALAEIYQIRIENQQKRKEGHNPDRMKGKKGGGREGRREGKGREGKGREGKEGRKGGRQEERNKGRVAKCCVHFPIYTCYFQRVAGPKQFANVGFKMWQRPCSLLILAATRCKHHAIICNLQMIISRYCECQSLIGLSFRKS